MSSIDDLPKHIKEAIEDLLSNLYNIKQDDLEDILAEIFGDDIINQLREAFEKGKTMSFTVDVDELEKMEELIHHFDEEDFGNYFFENEEEPYFEISGPYEDDSGEIIVELPGIMSLDQVEVYELDNEIYIYTVDDIENYRVAVPIPDYFEIDERLIKFRHGLLIIPYHIF